MQPSRRTKVKIVLDGLVTNAHIHASQAETEELARKVDSLNSENETLKSEINRLTESSEKMRVENATLRVLFTDCSSLHMHLIVLLLSAECHPVFDSGKT